MTAFRPFDSDDPVETDLPDLPEVRAIDLLLNLGQMEVFRQRLPEHVLPPSDHIMIENPYTPLLGLRFCVVQLNVHSKPKDVFGP